MESWFPKTQIPMVGLPWLVVSNIRGQLAALERVLDEAARLPLAGIIAAGDHCFGGPDPFDTWCRLRGLGAHMVRGKTDLALGSLKEAELGFSSHSDEHRWKAFLATRASLGDVVCRRLADLPKTEVVSLDDKSGIMIQHVLPAEERSGAVTAASLEEELASLTTCVAEDVLVVGSPELPFQHTLLDDRVQPLLVVAPGSVGRIYPSLPSEMLMPMENSVSVNAMLIQAFADGKVRAASKAFLLPSPVFRNVG